MASSPTSATSLRARAIGVHLAARVAVLAAVAVSIVADRDDPGSFGARLGAALSKSDGVWYLSIAHHGYGPPPPIGPDGVYTHLTSLAFFPLYPLLVRVVAVTGLPYLGAALLVTGVAGVVAALLVATWARPLLGDRGALALVLLWELFPANAVLEMAYSEALFVAAAAGSLVALQRRRWIVAGLAATVAGLTRPTGGAVVLAVWVAVAVDWRRTRRVTRAAIAGAVLAPVGLLVSLGHVAVVTGRLDGWFWLERTVWRSGFDGGWTALTHIGEAVSGGMAAHHLPEVVAAVVVAAVAVGAVVVVVRRRRGVPLTVGPPDLAYTTAAAVLAIGERGYFYVRPRLLFVAWPLLVPLARRLARVQVRGIGAITAVTLVCCAAVGYEAYLLVGWPKAL